MAEIQKRIWYYGNGKSGPYVRTINLDSVISITLDSYDKKMHFLLEDSGFSMKIFETDPGFQIVHDYLVYHGMNPDIAEASYRSQPFRQFSGRCDQ